MSDELWRISAVEAVTRLRKGEVSPLELVEASARRIAEGIVTATGVAREKLIG